MPAGPNHSGAALIPSTIVGEAVGREQRPFTAATVGSSYGLESETMTIHRAYSTSAEATPSSASELRLAKPQTGLTSGDAGSEPGPTAVGCVSRQLKLALPGLEPGLSRLREALMIV